MRCMFIFLREVGILTKHCFQLDQAADEVIKVNHLVVCIAGHQNLVQLIIQFKTCSKKKKQLKKNNLKIREPFLKQSIYSRHTLRKMVF